MPSDILKRHSDQPVLEPRPGHWDAVSTLNPGAILDADGSVLMLYRAVTDLETYVSRFGLARSGDGVHFERVGDEPVFQPEAPFETGGVEDARVTREGEDFLVAYAAVSVVPGPVYEEIDFFRRARADPYIERPGIPPMGPSFTCLLRSKDLRRFEYETMLTPPGIDDRDGILFPGKIGGRHVLLHRPTSWTGPTYGTEKPGIWLAFSEDLITWDYGRGGEYLLMKPRDGVPWEEARIGGGPPPVRTDAGWLVIYHGVDSRYVYRVGAALLDLDDPRKVLARSDDFLMEPKLPWERSGVIPNVVFPTAAVLRGRELLVYYGGADRVVGLAVADVDALVSSLVS